MFENKQNTLGLVYSRSSLIFTNLSFEGLLLRSTRSKVCTAKIPSHHHHDLHDNLSSLLVVNVVKLASFVRTSMPPAFYELCLSVYLCLN